MKRLYLIRNARSGWDEEGVSDFERAITSKGEKEARTIASYLKLRGIRPHLILSSCALRAQQSSDLLAEELGCGSGSVIYLKELYMTPPEAMRDIISEQDGGAESLFVVGHTPWLHELANSLMDEHLRKFPPMAVAAIDFNLEEWSGIAEGTGKLDFFIYPKQFEYYMPRQIRAHLPR